jgi:hypothetical protein
MRYEAWARKKRKVRGAAISVVNRDGVLVKTRIIDHRVNRDLSVNRHFQRSATFGSTTDTEQ